MKTSTSNERVVFSDSAEKSKGFTLTDDVTKLFSILSGMYSDPIEACVREYVCNAYDSHLMAGKLDVPIKIMVPSRFEAEPQLVIRDYGVGLSDDEVSELFTKYGGSNKDDSDEAIGGFGIGSKSAFAYQDGFMVTCYDGVEVRKYSVFKTTDDRPDYRLTTRGPSSEPRGVEVRIPVKPEDTTTFRDRIKRVLRWFDVDFNIAEEYIEKIERVQENEHGFRTDRNVISHRYAVLCGNVLYQLPGFDLQDDRVRNNIRIIIKADIGDVNIHPSRESLRIDERTKTFLENRITKYVDYLIEDTTKSLSAAWPPSSRLELAQTYDGILSNSYRNTFLPISHQLSSAYGNVFHPVGTTKAGSKLSDPEIDEVRKFSRGTVTYELSLKTDRYYKTKSYRLKGGPTIVIDKANVRQHSKAMLHLINVSVVSPRESYYWVDSSEDAREAEKAAYIFGWDKEDIVSLAELIEMYPMPAEITKKAKKAAGISRPIQCFRWQGSSNARYGAVSKVAVNLDDSKPQYYFKTYEGLIEECTINFNNGKSQLTIPRIRPHEDLNTLFYGILGLIGKDTSKTINVYGIQKPQWSKIPDNWVNIFDAFKEYIENFDFSVIKDLRIVDATDPDSWFADLHPELHVKYLKIRDRIFKTASTDKARLAYEHFRYYGSYIKFDAKVGYYARLNRDFKKHFDEICKDNNVVAIDADVGKLNRLFYQKYIEPLYTSDQRSICNISAHSWEGRCVTHGRLRAIASSALYEHIVLNKQSMDTFSQPHLLRTLNT